jgi:hypothetical protein
MLKEGGEPQKRGVAAWAATSMEVDDESGDDQELYCVCQQPWDGTTAMIECETV